MIRNVLLTVMFFSSAANADDMTYKVFFKPDIQIGGDAYTVVELDGALGEGVSQAVLAEMKKATTQRILFELNSPGGLNVESDAIKKGIDDLRAEGKIVDTFVANGSKCASACTLLFMYGTRRIAAETAAFMFHAVQYRSIPGAVNSFHTNAIVDYYIKQGLNPVWIKEQMKLGVFSQANEAWVSAKDSVQIKLGLVNELWSGLVQHRMAPIDPQIRPR